MMIKHNCENCDAKYKIIYNEEDCDDAPHFCCICGEYIVETDEQQDEDY